LVLTLLFTDNDDWSDADIVRGYRAQHHVEAGFRWMKDPHHICLRPQHHWTDQKIEVHVFCCVLALMLCSLLRRELQRQGIDLSIAVLLEQLGKIREVGIVYPAQDKRRSPTLKLLHAAPPVHYDSLADACPVKPLGRGTGATSLAPVIHHYAG
jgi:transposase